MSGLQTPQAMINTIIAKSIHQHWRFYLFEGLVLTGLGLGAIALPVLAGLTLTLVLGWLFIIAGAVGLVTVLGTMRGTRAPGLVWAALSSVVALVVGAVLLWDPVRSLATLTFVLVAYFIADGILMIFLALAHRRGLAGKWEWMLVNGVVDLILAAVVIAGFPGTLVWALGLLVGIDMVFGGTGLISMALTARREMSQ
ncbi:MAG: HdeD family acid-resistance protein [Acidiphilium sp.]